MTSSLMNELMEAFNISQYRIAALSKVQRWKIQIFMRDEGDITQEELRAIKDSLVKITDKKISRLINSKAKLDSE